jgi:hypothetical protein
MAACGHGRNRWIASLAAAAAANGKAGTPAQPAVEE